VIDPNETSEEETPAPDLIGTPPSGPPGVVPADDEPEERWLDEQAGPMVRPYVMTRGRTEPIRGTFDLITMVAATGILPAPGLGLDPEHQAALRLCAEPVSVAEIAGHLNLPTVTVRVLLGDLLAKGLITVEDPQTEAELVDDDDLYLAVIDGLKAL
jgi:hypothetical protein